MRLKEKCSGEKIHTRDISVAIHACGETDIVVEGVLKDDRLIPHYTISGEKVPPDTVHHMIVRMRVDGNTLSISEVEVEMPGTPHAQCIETRNSLEALVGMPIAPGFTGRVKKAVGGVRGCVHLTALFLAMAPAAIQGFWTHRARKPADEKIPAETFENYLIDTCRVWRRGGPLEAAVKKAVEEGHSKVQSTR